MRPNRAVDYILANLQLDLLQPSKFSEPKELIETPTIFCENLFLIVKYAFELSNLVVDSSNGYRSV
jgi:hypothetical protein